MAQAQAAHSHVHHCVIALTAEQGEHVQSTHTVLRTWFGNGTSVPVKANPETAVDAFVRAKNTHPEMVLEFNLPLAIYHDWVHNGYMQVCPWVAGYRVCGDIELNAVDPDFTLQTIE